MDPIQTQVKILKAYMGFKAGDVSALPESDAKDLITKGIAEEVKVEAPTIEKAVQDLNESFDKKLIEHDTKLIKEIEAKLGKAIGGLKSRISTAGNIIEVGPDGWEKDPRNGFPTIGSFTKAVYNASRGVISDQLRNLEKMELSKAAAGASEGVAAAGGYAVPVEYANFIFNDIQREGSLFSKCFKIPMTSSSLKLPASNYTQQGSFGTVAYWEAEGATIPTSNPAFRQPSLTLNKLTCLTPVTSELLEDGIAVEPFITSVASSAIEWKVNDAIINGTGAGMPTGIVGHAATVNVAIQAGQAIAGYGTASAFNATNAIQMRASLNSINNQPLGMANWYYNRADIEPKLYTVQDPGGRYLFVAPGMMGNSPMGSLLGYPTEALSNCQALGTPGDIIVGNWDRYMLGYKATGPNMAISIHLYFASDQTAYRWTWRMDGRPIRDAVLKAANGSGTYGDFVTLATRS